MIEYGTVLRLSDGTPLSASTDGNASDRIFNAKKTIKLIAQNFSILPRRVCIQDEVFSIHCIHNIAVGFVAVCDPTFSHLLAYSFLEELSREFNMLYTASVVAAVKRPYAFTEFDSFLQKLQQLVNKPGMSMQVGARLNLARLSSELTVAPPRILSAGDLAPPAPPPPFTSPNAGDYHAVTLPPISNGYASVDNTQVGVSVQLTPLSLFSKAVIVVAALLAVLDVYRGLTSLSQSNLEEYDGPSPFHGFGFMLEMFALSAQVEVLQRYYRFRKLCTVVCLTVLSLTALLLLSGVRDVWLSVCYVAVSAKLAHSTLTRIFQKKLNKFTV